MKVFKSPKFSLVFLVLFINFSLVFFTPSNEDHVIHIHSTSFALSGIKDNHVSVISPQEKLSAKDSYNNTKQTWIKVLILHNL
uniref:Legume lectin domain-containing protein n=1 Tax=Lotus japonicus TaxID=34305 RepID=I3TAI2_LOTJA|nr:unknown [Lotus japonicus]